MQKILLAFFLFAYSITGFAFSWSDLWLRKDEQAARLLAHGKAAEAAVKFENNSWKSAAYYRAGHYDQTVDLLKSVDTPLANYNRGNALAHLGQYEDAIAAYNKTLVEKPDDQDAKYNRDLLKKILKQQKRQQHNQTAKHQQKNSQQQKQQQSSQNSQQQKNKNNSAKQQSSQSQQLSQSSQQQKTQNNSSKQQSNQDKQQQGRQANQVPQQQMADNNNSKSPPAQQNQLQAQQQAAKQWLRRVPDDPGGLLRQKFLRDYLRSQPGDN